MKKLLIPCLVAALVTVTTSAQAVITLSGSLQTGSPTPTLLITEPIVFSITSGGTASRLVFDNWVAASDGQASTALNADPSHSIQFIDSNSGSTLDRTFYGIIDNINLSSNAVTPNDGVLTFNNTPVTTGQTLTLQPGTYTLGANSGFNLNVPASFTGRVFLANNTYVALSSPVFAPEPSTWTLLTAGAMGTGLAILRRRTTACRQVTR